MLLVLTLVVGIAVSGNVSAQSPSPSLPIMSDMAFGWVSMSGVDPTLDLLTSFAPTMLCVHDAGYQTGGEYTEGVFTFGKFTVVENFQSVITDVGGGALRISHYGYTSNSAELPGIPGAKVQTNGDSIDMSYAQRFGKTTLGVTVIPQDNADIQMNASGLAITGTAATDIGARLGAVQQLTNKVRVGLEYSYQKDTATLQLPVPLVPTPTTLSGHYLVRCGTAGASWQITTSTKTYVAYQRLLGTGPDFLREGNQTWCGVSQNITKSLSVSANYFGGGQNCFISYRSKYGVFNIAYTHDALNSARDFLGHGNALFAGIDLAI